LAYRYHSIDAMFCICGFPDRQATIIDGDTLEIHGQGICLSGIDAPESDQLCPGDDSLPYRCCAEAANGLDRFIASRLVSHEQVDVDRYRRVVAFCSVGVDLREWIVRLCRGITGLAGATVGGRIIARMKRGRTNGT
jgi:endonuclease YncB( thermonuclease family)